MFYLSISLNFEICYLKLPQDSVLGVNSDNSLYLYHLENFFVSLIYLRINLIQCLFQQYVKSVAALVSCYCFTIVAAFIVLGLGGIVSVVCSIIRSKGFKPFRRDLTRATTSVLHTYFPSIWNASGMKQQNMDLLVLRKIVSIKDRMTSGLKL